MPLKPNLPNLRVRLSRWTWRPGRHAYYLNAIRALTVGEAPEEALWPLLKVWTDLNCAVSTKPSEAWLGLYRRPPVK